MQLYWNFNFSDFHATLLKFQLFRFSRNSTEISTFTIFTPFYWNFNFSHFHAILLKFQLFLFSRHSTEISTFSIFTPFYWKFNFSILTQFYWNFNFSYFHAILLKYQHFQAVEPAAGFRQTPTNSMQAQWYLQTVTVSLFTICLQVMTL